jgi:hypothetical protein
LSGEAVATVSRFGGHAAAEAALMARTGVVQTGRNVGFVLFKEAGNTLRISWNSGTINLRNFGSRAAPVGSRAAIRAAIEQETGMRVVE